jgi:ammonium transporter, Amt family
MLGGFWTGIFATSRISALDGESMYSGAIDGNGVQVGKQLAEICAIASYSFSVSCCLLMILKYIPGLHLRVSDEVEILGYDIDQFHDETIGEWALWEQHPPQHTEGVAPPESTESGSGTVTPPLTKVEEKVTEKVSDL